MFYNCSVISVVKTKAGSYVLVVCAVVVDVSVVVVVMVVVFKLFLVVLVMVVVVVHDSLILFFVLIVYYVFNEICEGFWLDVMIWYSFSIVNAKILSNPISKEQTVT